MYSIKYKRSVLRYLRKMPSKEAGRVRDAVKDISNNNASPGMDIVKLQGRDGYRLRIGGYRVIYTLDDEIVILTVEKIAPRGDVYKGSN